MLSIMYVCTLFTIYRYMSSEYDGFGKFMGRFDEIQTPATRTHVRTTLSNDAIVRVPHGQGSKPHPSTVFLHHLARGNPFTAGPMSEPLSLTSNQFEFVVGYSLSTQSLLRAY